MRAFVTVAVACLLACGPVEDSGATDESLPDAGDAGSHVSDAASDAEQDSAGDAAGETGDAAPCIPFLGACVDGLLCCDGTTCFYDGCGIDPACAWPEQPCDGFGLYCCTGDACGADGTCPGAAPGECSDLGETCGGTSTLICCPGLECHPNGSCIDLDGCSLAGEVCGSACCNGLTCNPAGICEGSVSCSPSSIGCFDCAATSCCAELLKCESESACADQVACLKNCLETDPYAQCEPYCNAGSALMDVLSSCTASECAAECQ